MHRTQRAILLILSAMFLWSGFCAGATWNGRWKGTAAIPTMQMRIGLDLDVRGDTALAHVDLPDIGEAHVPITRVVVDSSRMRLVLQTRLGADEFFLRLLGDRLQGSWASALAPDTALLVLKRVTPEPPLFTEEEIWFQNGAIELSGTLLIPLPGERHPAIVFVHGSGPETRHASRFMAERFAEAGVAALIYDKRGTGRSGGSWSESDFGDLAGDAIAAVSLLRGRSDIDLDRIGLRGQSQGGWVAPLAASQTRGVAAIITISGSLVTPALQGHWSTEYALLAAGRSRNDVERAEFVLRAKDEATRTGDWTSFRRAVEDARDESWFDFAGIDPDPDTTSWFWPWYRSIMDFDPVPVLRTLDVPLLAILGEEDRHVSSERSRRILSRMREDDGKSITMRIYEGADHNLRIQSKPSEPFRWGVFPDGYVSDQIAWFLETTRSR